MYAVAGENRAMYVVKCALLLAVWEPFATDKCHDSLPVRLDASVLQSCWYGQIARYYLDDVWNLHVVTSFGHHQL